MGRWLDEAMSRISHYELLERIGRDGPAEIYRARDLKLDRGVAVKILRADVRDQAGAVERFTREARIASLVTHPHVCAVHDSGDEDGRAFLVCELLEGQALDELMAGAALPAGRTFDIGIQLADALGAAHRRGVVHGGVKPSNVFVTIDGHVKLLELGAVAAAAHQEARPPDSPSADTTNPLSSAPGDAAEFFHPYLSPEQVAGRGPDERSDIFATGALLYHMATGRAPFTAATPAETARAIASADPPAPRTVNPAVPEALEPIIARALAKDPAARYLSAGDLLTDPRRVRRATDLPSGVQRATRRDRRAPRALTAVAVLAILAAVATAAWWAARPPAPGEVARSRVLVGHLANGTADPDFDGTLREALTVHLGQSPYLELVPDDRVRAQLRMMGLDEDRRMTHDVAAEVCQRLGLQAMIEGSVSAVGRSTVIALVATDCVIDATIAREQIEVERKEDVLWALREITTTMRTALGESGASLEIHNVPIEDATTPSFDALKAYTEAVARRAEGREFDAIPLLERAIEIDPKFALAHTTLSSLYGGLGETGRSAELARLAYEHRDRVSERERLFIAYQYHDRVTGDSLQARDTLEVWKRTYPRDYRPANALAVLLIRFGQFEAAASEAREAMRRNPDHAFPYSNLAYALRGAGRYAEAGAAASDGLARGLETLPMHRLLYQLAEIEGNEAAARSELAWAAAHRREFDFTGARAQVAAYRGRLDEARTLYREVIVAARREGFPEVADAYGAQAALTEALFGFRTEALALARPIARGSPSHEAQLRAATALALAGAAGDAGPIVRRLAAARPDDTLMQAGYVVPADAAIHLAGGRADTALEVLRRAAPYEFGIVAALMPAYLRGEAHLRLGAFQDAAREFTAVLEHRGADPFSPVLPMARLRLARALEESGDTARARDVLEALRAEWTGADAAVLRLLEAAPAARLTLSR
jgi:eukaryotic-like serine/threonine-protein kinase